MQSHLTRQVFRAIINNEPLHFSRCRRNQLLHTISPTRVRPWAPVLGNTSRRTFFAFNFNPSNADAGEGQPATLPSEKGLQPMTDLKRSLEDKSRAPPSHTLTKAFQIFFATRVENPGVINGFQARLLSITWRHLKAQQGELDDREFQDVFSVESLEKMLFVLQEAECLPEARATILKIARYVYAELRADHGFGVDSVSRPALLAYINLLASNGCPAEARLVILNFGGRFRGAKPSPWLTVMKGFAMADDNRQLRNITREFEKYGMKFDQASHEELINLLIEQGQFKAVQTAYQCPITGAFDPSTPNKMADIIEPSISTKKNVVKQAILNSETKWAEPIFHSLPQGPVRETVGITLLWEAAHGSNASSLAEKAKTWIASDEQIQDAITIADVNSLIQYANVSRNHELAPGFVRLVEQWGLVPDQETHLLRLESYIQAGAVEQTLEILEQQIDLSLLPTENLPLCNKLIAMLCLSEQRDALFGRISSLLDPLFQENVRLEPTTVAALTRMLLYRYDWEAISELLRPRLGTYDDEGKGVVRNVITDFILDLGQKDQDAEDPRRRPKPDTYARCFQGIARNSDKTNLELVHNMLKLDLEVNLTTRIQNGLMLAYAACEMPEKSMEIFRQILGSDEGPSNKTIGIFFKVCEKHHNGAQEALKMLKKVKKVGIEIDRRLYTGYIEAVAAQCEFDVATTAIDSMQAEIGVPPTSTTIGLFYNAIPYQYWKDQVEKWAGQKYPELWAHLDTMERSEHEEGLKFDGILNEIWV
ncbi:hypothetical protein N7526_003102 [Penicillium atrosanguineum]|nr:hypothetical protein N7526_003102 [Penicillium atrosanguineum]